MASVDFEVRIENIYEDPLEDSPDAMEVEFPENAKKVRYRHNVVEVTLEMSIDGEYLPSPGDDEAWDEWGEKYIYPHTGIGRPDGDAAYFAEISAVTSLHADDEFDYIIGKSWEWGT